MIDDRRCRFIARNVNIESRIVGVVEYDTAFFFHAKHAVDVVNQSNLWDDPNLESTQAMQKLCLFFEGGFGNQSVERSVNITPIKLYTYDEKWTALSLRSMVFCSW